MSVLEPIIDVVVRRAAETPGRVAFVFADGARRRGSLIDR